MPDITSAVYSIESAFDLFNTLVDCTPEDREELHLRMNAVLTFVTALTQERFVVEDRELPLASECVF